MDHTIEVRAMRPGEHLERNKRGKDWPLELDLYDPMQYLYKLKF